MEENNLIYRWALFEQKYKELFGEPPEIEKILFLVGLQSLKYIPRQLTKTEKNDLITLGLMILFEKEGYFRLTGFDEKGWPLIASQKKLPSLSEEEWKTFLKQRILDYFELS